MEKSKLSVILFFILFLFFLSSNAISVVWPISGSSTPDTQTSPFGSRLLNGFYDFHHGIDHQAAMRTRVLAVLAASEVLYRGDALDGCGNKIRLRHSNDMTQYCHLDAYVIEQDLFEEGELVGLSGNTAGTQADPNRTVDPHLHLDWVHSNNPSNFANNNKVNARDYLPYDNWWGPLFQDFIDYSVYNGANYIKVPVTTPYEELDFNQIEITITDGNNTDITNSILSGTGTDNRVNFNYRTNCGSDNAAGRLDDNIHMTNYIAIEVQNFQPGVNQILTFYFGVNSIEWGKYNQITVSATATDVRGKSNNSERTFYPGSTIFENVPNQYILAQNYPNPFNPKTKINYQLAGAGHVRLNIFNSLGQKVKNLLNEQKQAGESSVFWDGKDQFGNDAASATYFYQLEVLSLQGDKRLVKRKKMTLIR